MVRAFDLAGAMSLEALRGTPAAFDARIQKARPHAGQIAAAAHLCGCWRDARFASRIGEDDPRVQDAYCLRCMPQVHGAVRGVLEHVAGVMETEAGSATDNPLMFPRHRRGRLGTSGCGVFQAAISMARRCRSRWTMRRSR